MGDKEKWQKGKGSYIFESEVGCFVGDFEVFEDGDGAGGPAWGFSISLRFEANKVK
jgi:hypothetical protein